MLDFYAMWFQDACATRARIRQAVLSAANLTTEPQEDHVRLETLIAASLVLSFCATATAETRDSSASPQFSAAETGTVGRNELLRTLIETDPWLVRQILDAIAERSATNSDEFVARALDGIDRANNPDLVSSTRTASASIDWINLLRRAREEKEALRSKPRQESIERSAKGSVELLEVLKQARKEKDTAK
jgi:hypothetical protein